MRQLADIGTLVYLSPTLQNGCDLPKKHRWFSELVLNHSLPVVLQGVLLDNR